MASMKYSGGKRVNRIARTIALLLLILLSACRTAPPTTGELESRPPIRSKSPAVQAQFDSAETLLKEGRYQEAAQEFRLLQAAHQGDETAELAELFIARTLLTDLDRHFQAELEERQPVNPEVFSLLIPLANSKSVDERIRYAAQVYLAIAHALDQNIGQAFDALSEYPGASLSPVVFEHDKIWAWPLVAEGLNRAGRYREAILAWGKLHTYLSAESEQPSEHFDADLPAPEPDPITDHDSSTRSGLLAMAKARAFTIQEDLGPGDDQALLASAEPLARAAATWAYIQAAVKSTPDEETIEALTTLFNEIAPDFLIVDAADRAAELSVILTSQAGPGRLVVGALLPLTGPNRAVGYRALSGLLVAQRAFHGALEPMVTLVIEDAASDPVAAYHRLANQGALAIIGPLDTAQARQLLEPARERQVPLMTLTADSALPRSQGEGEEFEARPPVFRNFVDALAEARAAAHLSFETIGDRRATVVYPDMGYGRAMAAAFADEFRNLGGEILAEIAYDRQGSDFVDTAKRVARTEPDAIFLPDTAAKVAEISAFLAQENIWGIPADQHRNPRSKRLFVHYLGTSLWQEPVLLRQAASYIQGAVIPAWSSPAFDDQQTRQFAGNFDGIYGRRPDSFEVFAYDSMVHLRSLLIDGRISDAQGIATALVDGNWRQGATGEYRFLPDGEALRKLRFIAVDGDDWTVLPHTIQTPLNNSTNSDQPSRGEGPGQTPDHGR